MYALCHFLYIAMHLRMVGGKFVWCHLCVTEFMLIVSNALYISNAIVRSAGLFWLKPVVMVLFMLCSA